MLHMSAQKEPTFMFSLQDRGFQKYFYSEGRIVTKSTSRFPVHCIIQTLQFIACIYFLRVFIVAFIFYQKLKIWFLKSVGDR